MSDLTSIKVANLNLAIKALQAVGTPTAEISEAAKQAGEIVASTARGIVPVRSGRLRSTIRSKKQARRAIVSAGNNGRVPYAGPIHFGWFYDKNNFVQKNIMPNPFFARALGLKREEVYKTYFENINKLANKYWKP
jgi:hypothetical protein